MFKLWRHPAVRLALLPMMLAVAFSVPLGLMRPEPARAACYWGPMTTVTKYRFRIAADTYWTGKVRYQVGYNCSGYKTDLYVDYIETKMEWRNSPSYVRHVDDKIMLAKWLHEWNNSWSEVYSNGVDVSCLGTCSISRGKYPRVTIPYNTNAALMDYYSLNVRAAGGGGGGLLWYKFLTGVAHMGPGYTTSGGTLG